MPINTAIVVATFILAVTAIAMVIFLAGRKRQAQEEEMRQAAMSRGWKFDSRSERGKRTYTWTGSTDGMTWRAESIRSASKSDSGRHRHYVSRWHGDFSSGISGAMVLLGVPKGKEMPAFSVAEDDSMFAKLAQKAAGFAFDKAIDMYFGEAAGKEVDGASLHRVNTSLPGFVVMAADKDEGARILSQGLESALGAAMADKSSVLSNEDRPSILLRSHGISLARTEPFAGITELEAFIRAGIGLSRAFKFARPFA